MQVLFSDDDHERLQANDWSKSSSLIVKMQKHTADQLVRLVCRDKSPRKKEADGRKFLFAIRRETKAMESAGEYNGW